VTSAHPSRHPAILAVMAGLAGGLLVWYYYTRFAPGIWSDFDQVWIGSRALLRGQDPYVEVPKAFPGPLFYPLPALLVALPFALCPLLIARILFGAVTAGLATWGILRYQLHAWPLLISAPLLYGIARGQWAPLLVAATLLPTLGGVMAAKPSIGLATFAYRPTIAPMIGVALLGVISFVVQPSWFITWLSTARTAPHVVVPALMPGGFILFTAFARWRRSDARLLAVLACVPQAPAPYDLFVMALIPRTLRKSLIMGLSWNVLYLVTLATHSSTPSTVADVQHGRWSLSFWPLWLVLGYYPALLAILSPTPLVDLPREFVHWTPVQQRSYRILWRAGLTLVSGIALYWTYLIWHAVQHPR
jgi:hypothetical protein